MDEQLLRAWVWQTTFRHVVGGRVRAALVRDETGEGVISAAIAVLVMAFLGVLMWQLFGDTLRKANGNVNTRLDQLK